MVRRKESRRCTSQASREQGDLLRREELEVLAEREDTAPTLEALLDRLRDVLDVRGGSIPCPAAGIRSIPVERRTRTTGAVAAQHRGRVRPPGRWATSRASRPWTGIETSIVEGEQSLSLQDADLGGLLTLRQPSRRGLELHRHDPLRLLTGEVPPLVGVLSEDVPRVAVELDRRRRGAEKLEGVRIVYVETPPWS